MKHCILFLLIFVSTNLSAQFILTDDTFPPENASRRYIFNIKSPNKGVLLPRIPYSKLEILKSQYAKSDFGMMFYCNTIDSAGLYYFHDMKWKKIFIKSKVLEDFKYSVDTTKTLNSKATDKIPSVISVRDYISSNGGSFIHNRFLKTEIDVKIKNLIDVKDISISTIDHDNADNDLLVPSTDNVNEFLTFKNLGSSAGGKRITNLANPISPRDIVTKSYVDKEVESVNEQNSKEKKSYKDIDYFRTLDQYYKNKLFLKKSKNIPDIKYSSIPYITFQDSLKSASKRGIVSATAVSPFEIDGNYLVRNTKIEGENNNIILGDGTAESISLICNGETQLKNLLFNNALKNEETKGLIYNKDTIKMTFNKLQIDGKLNGSIKNININGDILVSGGMQVDTLDVNIPVSMKLVELTDEKFSKLIVDDLYVDNLTLSSDYSDIVNLEYNSLNIKDITTSITQNVKKLKFESLNGTLVLNRARFKKITVKKNCEIKHCKNLDTINITTDSINVDDLHIIEGAKIAIYKNDKVETKIDHHFTVESTVNLKSKSVLNLSSDGVTIKKLNFVKKTSFKLPGNRLSGKYGRWFNIDKNITEIGDGVNFLPGYNLNFKAHDIAVRKNLLINHLDVSKISVNNTSIFEDLYCKNMVINNSENKNYPLQIYSGSSKLEFIPTRWRLGLSNIEYYVTKLNGYSRHKIGLYCIGSISAHHFQTENISLYSDIRSKVVLGKSDATKDLETLKNIEVVDYKMIDTTMYGSKISKKVIAQQVELFYPQAITLKSEFIPNIYKYVDSLHISSDFKVTAFLNNNLNLNDIVKGRIEEIDSSGIVIKEIAFIGEIIKVYKNSFDIRSSSKLIRNSDNSVLKLFIYGKKVTDFRTVDYDALSMLNISATQELSRYILRGSNSLEHITSSVDKTKLLYNNIINLNDSVNFDVNYVENNLTLFDEKLSKFESKILMDK